MTETPYRATDSDLSAVLHLIRTAFAGMDGRIDPPSSVHRLTRADLALPGREVWVIGQPPLACMVLTPRADTLYLGKLAVVPAAQRRGHARRLIAQALMRAAALGHPSVTLQTRVELTENHAAFTRLGFEEIARTAHAGFDRLTTITYRRTV
ncbi:Predicted N-acetyltransferase YhbS [Loktanella fryxellensis]|uniref:Predicted N-acetyltransferase YhbS n=1 Tax=Loktanella fryxellensis TaxID=245187 RepID=A0A1H8AY64_9RHOB|nr:GNAT family N-acetyltransferase [Loktanella fryxellensis]SEM75503.1 Predicted N-acetyltransferase YhbS [Loktanella fryxellensis]